MSELEALYFEWLLTRLEPDGVSEEVAYVCGLLHNCEFERRVGRDINRASDGLHIRQEFILGEEDLDRDLVEAFMARECSWFEMLVALSERLDFLYEGGVEGRFTELITNLGLAPMLRYHHPQNEEEDQDYVDVVTADVDNNRFDRNGHGGLFPLMRDDHPDQRNSEIWDQHAAYFQEKLEGVLWTSTR